MKKIILTSVALAMLSVSAYATPKFAVVDIQGVASQVPQGTLAIQSLEKKFVLQNRQLKKRSEQLANNISNFNKNKSTYTADQKTKEQHIIDKDKVHFQDALAQFNKDVQQQQQRLAQKFQTSLNNAVSSVAKKYDYDLVFNSQALLYSKTPYTDISDKVIQEMNHPSQGESSEKNT